MTLKRYIGARLGLAIITSVLLSGTALTYAQIPVRDSDNPVRQPFRKVFDKLERDSVTRAAVETVVQVPQGKRLVIEQITLRADVPANGLVQQIRVSLTTELSGERANYVVPVPRQLNQFIAMQQMRVYADPLTTVDLEVNIENNEEEVNMEFRSVVVSGYFVDLP